MRTYRTLALLACLLSTPLAQAADNACVVPDLGLPLAGAGAVDCGVAPVGKRWQRARVAGCARRAIARGKPVRFGIGIMGIDAFACDVVVMDSDKTFWRVSFDWDVAVSGGPSASVGRCAAIDPDWKDSAGADHFGPLDCVPDDAAFERARIRMP